MEIELGRCEQFGSSGHVMLMMIRRLLASVISLLLVLAIRYAELMGMLVIGGIRLTNDSIATSRFRLDGSYASGCQQRRVSEINWSVRRAGRASG